MARTDISHFFAPSQGIIFTAGTMWNFLQTINVPIHVQEARRLPQTCVLPALALATSILKIPQPPPRAQEPNEPHVVVCWLLM